MKARTTIPLLSLLALGSGCGRDCAGVADLTARDWCYYDEAVDAADSDDIDGAIGAISAIQSSLVFAAATERMMELAPLGVGYDTVVTMCSRLPGEAAQSCRKTWDRRHLWGR